MADLSMAVEQFLAKWVVYDVSLLSELWENKDDGKKRSNGEIVQEVMAIYDKKSKAYRSAMRSVQRWKDGTRHPNKISKDKIVKALQLRKSVLTKRVDKIGRIGVMIDGLIQISSDKRRRKISWELDAHAAKQFLTAALRDSIEAYEIFFEQYGAPYGMVADESVIIKEI